MRIVEGDYSDHSMIALYPDVGLADKLAGLVDGGESAAELHLTVVYTGRTDDVNQAALWAAVEAVHSRAPIEARISGLGRFAGATDDDPDVIVALVDSPALDRLRRDQLDALADAGVDVEPNHGFVPHITLAYVPAGDDLPLQRIAPVDTTFTVLTAKHGDVRAEYPLDPAGTAELALRAYVSGWAASGGPLTDRVRAGARVAAQLAESDPGRDGVMEATLRLGHMEGTWAAVFGRRDQLHDREGARLAKVWADLIDGVDVDTLVDDAQDAAAGFTGDVEHRAALGTFVAGYVVAALREREGTDGWQALRQGLRDAVADAVAEGAVDALALSADRAGYLGFDYAAAHTDMLAAVAEREDLWTATDRALHQAVQAVAARTGRGLLSRIIDGAPTGELQAWTRDDLATSPGFAVEVRYALDQALAGSMWALYQRGNVDKVNFVTVGDGQVCAPCRAAESKNPYPIFDLPVLPMHYGCRCVSESVDPLPVDLFIAYVQGR